MTDNTPPADAGQGGAAPAAAPAATPSEWYAGMPEDLRGYVQLKGWKDQSAAVESYRNLEKLRGVPAERLLSLPEKADDPAWGQVWERLGRPQTADQYELSKLEGADPAFAGEASKWFHEAGIPKAQAHALAQKFNQYAAAQQQAADEARAQQAEIEWGELKKEWGQSFPQQEEMARRAARQFGMDEETLSALEHAMGPKKLMQLWARIGEGLGESPAHGMASGSQSFAMTPEAAKARITQLMGDKEWSAKYIGGNTEAKAEMERLHRLAYGS